LVFEFVLQFLCTGYNPVRKRRREKKHRHRHLSKLADKPKNAGIPGSQKNLKTKENSVSQQP